MPKISSFVANVGLSLVCLLGISIAHGQPKQTVCRFSSASGVAFGIYNDASSVPRDTTANVIIDCTRNGGPRNLTLTLALGPSATSGSISTRRLQGSGSTLIYNLYRDSSMGLVWGQTPGADTMTTVLSIPNNSTASSTFTIFGRINALQNATVGTYADSVLATVSY